MFFFGQEVYYYDWNQGLTELDMNDLNTVWERTPTFLPHALHFQTRHFDQSVYCINIAKLKLSGQHIVLGKLYQHSN